MFQEEAVTILREQLELWSTTAQVSQRELEKEQLTSSKLCEEVAALRQECQEAGTSRAVEINELRAKNLRELSASLHELQERNERLRVLQLKNDALEQTVATERTRYEVQLERTEARNLEEINKMQANNLKELAASLHELQDRNERLRELHLKNAELEAELTLEKRSKAEALERSPEERKTPRREEQRSGSVRQFPSLGCMPTGPAPDYPGTHEISAPPSAVASTTSSVPETEAEEDVDETQWQHGCCTPDDFDGVWTVRRISLARTPLPEHPVYDDGEGWYEPATPEGGWTPKHLVPRGGYDMEDLRCGQEKGLTTARTPQGRRFRRR